MSETRAPYTAKSFVIIDEQNNVYFAVTSEIDARAKALRMADETGRMVLLFVQVDEFKPGQNIAQPGYENENNP